MTRRIALFVVIAAIMSVTLVPNGAKSPQTFSLCVACGPRGTADAILNAVLFLPFGFALVASGIGVATVIATGAALSTVIELLQTIVPGRDPAAGDILFNSIGAGIGAFIGLARRPLLRPTRRQARFLTLLSLAIAASILIATALLLAPHASGGFVAREQGGSAVVSVETRAASLGFDQPDVTLAPTLGQGWALLVYPDAIARRWGSVINALWMFALLVPTGFWSRGRLLPIAAAVIVVILIAIPRATDSAPTTSEEWVGAALGFLAGAGLRQLYARRFSGSVSSAPRS